MDGNYKHRKTMKKRMLAIVCAAAMVFTILYMDGMCGSIATQLRRCRNS